MDTITNLIAGLFALQRHAARLEFREGMVLVEEADDAEFSDVEIAILRMSGWNYAMLTPERGGWIFE